MGTRGIGARPKPKRHVSEISQTSGPPAWLNPKLSRAERVIVFVEGLTLRAGKGAGTPFVLREWQREIIRAIYHPDEDGQRVIVEALVTIGRKNGKTQIAAALCAAHLYGPEAILGGECYSAAADREQAGRIFRELENFVVNDPAADERINIKRFEKTLEVLDGPGKGSIYRALSSDATKAHSLSPSFVVLDELAQWRGREMFENLRTGTGAHEGGSLFLVISTVSADPHSVMTEVTDYARRVLEGTIDDPSFYGCIFEVPKSDDPDEHARQMTDPEIWKLANPALDDFLSLAAVRKDAREAVRIPARESAFRNLRLNQPTTLDDRAIPAAEWNACLDPDLDAEALRGRPCWGALDLGSTSDLTSLTLFFPDDAGGAILPWFWVPRERLQEREERDRVPYVQWHADGFLEAPEGRAVDRRAIARRLAEVSAKYDLRQLAFDRWRFEDLQVVLNDEGIELPLVPFGQGYASMGPAVDAFEALLLDRGIRHNGHPVLAWCAANLVYSMDPAGARKPDKSKARERIDGLVTLIMACGIHAKAMPEDDTRVFDESDVDAVFA